MNPIMTLVSAVFEPAAKLIDEIHTSDEERIDAKRRLLDSQSALTMKVLDYEANIQGLKSSIIVAEAQGDSWLQSSWRPITMLTFLVLVVLDSFNILPNRLASDAWALLQLGLGGYILTRGAEKTAKTWKAKDVPK